MARGDKKRTANAAVSRPTEPASRVATRIPAPESPPEGRARAHPGPVSPPRTTTDDPWRDLHPVRIWPD